MVSATSTGASPLPHGSSSSAAAGKSGILMLYDTTKRDFNRCVAVAAPTALCFFSKVAGRLAGPKHVHPAIPYDTMRAIYGNYAAGARTASKDVAAAAASASSSPKRGASQSGSFERSASFEPQPQPPQQERGDPPRPGVVYKPVYMHSVTILVELESAVVVLRTVDEKGAIAWLKELRVSAPEVPHAAITDASHLRGFLAPGVNSQLFPRKAKVTFEPRTSPSPPKNVDELGMGSANAAAPKRTRVASQSASAVRNATASGKQRQEALTLHADPNAAAPAATKFTRNPSSSATAVRKRVASSSATSAPLRGPASGNNSARGDGGRTATTTNTSRPAPARAAAPAPTAAPTTEGASGDVAALRAQLAAVTQERDEAMARNLDLDLEASNATVRVLELEQQVQLLSDGAAEWRRRYASLEQQLKVQESSYHDMVQNEKNEIVLELRKDIDAHWASLSAEWRNKEAALEATIEELAKELGEAKVANERGHSADADEDADE